MTDRYFCRSCNLPLVIDDSLQNLSHAQQNLLTLDYAKKPTIPTTDNSATIGLDKAETSYNEYPQIPESRMLVFKGATAMLSKGTPNDNGMHTGRTTMGRAITSDSLQSNVQIENSQEGIVTGLKEMRLDRNSHNQSNSFVYLHDKVSSSEALSSVFNSEEGDSMDSSNMGSYNNRDIRDARAKRSDISSKVDSLEMIFNIISSKYEVDYPVCNDCAETLVREMKRKYETLNKDKDVYLHFLKKLSSQNGPHSEKTKEALNELEELQKQEEQLLELLKQEDNNHEELNTEVMKLEEEIADLEKEEIRLCKEKNMKEIELSDSKNKLEQTENSYNENMDLLDSLRKTNVFGNFFEIDTNGQFATINELRLGCLDDTKVTWHEINAALGQLILLLSTCLNILDLNLSTYKLIPMGSTSKIEKYEKDPRTSKITKSQLQMYCTGDFSIGGFFAKNDLDLGMVTLIDVIDQMGQHLRTLDDTFTLPYVMKGEKVAGYNIKPSSRSGWASWTSACKCLMINVKWIQAFCFAHYSNLA